MVCLSLVFLSLSFSLSQFEFIIYSIHNKEQLRVLRQPPLPVQELLRKFLCRPQPSLVCVHFS